MNRNTKYIPYNAKLTNEEIKSSFSANNGLYNVVSLYDYNNILKSFNVKNEKEQDLLKRAQEREKLRLKGLKLTERIKSKSIGNASAYERMKEKEKEKQRQKQKSDEEWKKILEKEKKENKEKIKEKIFNSRSDVIGFNKKVQEANIYYERQLQIELKKRRKELRDEMDKKLEQHQVDILNNEILMEKVEERKKKLEDLEAGKQLKEQIIQNRELKQKQKKEEEEEILNSKGLLFDPEKTEEEKKESLRMLYEDIDKQIQYKQKLKNKKLEEEKKFENDILEYNNNKMLINDRINNVRLHGINKRITDAELVGRNLKSDREEQIENFYNIMSKKKPLFSDEADIMLRNKYMKHQQENTAFQLKQIEEERKLREKEKEETRKFYYEKGIKALNELHEEETKRIEKEKQMNLEQEIFNKRLMEDKKKRELEYLEGDLLDRKLEEEKKKNDEDFNNYVYRCINELELKGRDVRNLYKSLILEKTGASKQDTNNIPDTFRRLNIDGLHNAADDDIISYLQKNKDNEK